MKGIQNRVAGAVLRLEYNPALNPTNEYTHATLGVSTKKESAQRWKSSSHDWQGYNESNAYTQTLCVPMNKAFVNCSEEDKIYPMKTAEIAVAQRANPALKHLFKCNTVVDKGLEVKLSENTVCVCNDGQLVIPKPLQVHAVKWYYH
jgi:hypothetical protein